MEELINAMTSKGHSESTARATIEGRGFDELAREYLGSTGGSQSASAPDISGVPSVQNYIQSQFQKEDTALAPLIDKMVSQEKPLDIYSRLETESGLPTLKRASQTLSKEIANVEDTLESIEPQVEARSRESILTQAQREGLVQSKREPFLEKLTKLGTSLGRVGDQISSAERGISTKTSLALQGQAQELEPLKLRYQVLTERNSRALSGFTADRQTMLDQIYAKFERQNYLDDREWELAQELAQEEKSYLKTLQTTAAKSGYSVTGSESADELLSIIGTKAAEEIAYSRSNTSRGTQSEREQGLAVIALRKDANNGDGFENIVRRYGDILPMWQIRDEYNNNSPYGAAKESEAEAQGFREPQENDAEAKTIEYLDQVRTYETKEEALRDYEIFKDVMQAQGVNTQTILDAINRKFE